MHDHLGETYTGIISGVTEWGLFVELDANKCEGLVSVRDLGDDYYDFDEKNFCLVGRRKGLRFRLGDKVTVSIARADIDKKQLDLLLEDPRLSPKDEDSIGKINPFATKSKKGKVRKSRKEAKSKKSKK